MLWIKRPSAAGRKSNYMWYFVKSSHSKLLRRKKFFNVKSDKKGVALSVKPFTTYISQNKAIQLIRYEASYISPTNVLFMKNDVKKSKILYFPNSC